MAKVNVTSNITAENSFSDSTTIRGIFLFSLSGNWAGSCTVQRSFDNGSTWVDIESFSENTELTGTAPVECLHRFGVKTGDYTSGTIVGRLAA